jgi:hypothetical protein
MLCRKYLDTSVAYRWWSSEKRSMRSLIRRKLSVFRTALIEFKKLFSIRLHLRFVRDYTRFERSTLCSSERRLTDSAFLESERESIDSWEFSHLNLDSRCRVEENHSFF